MYGAACGEEIRTPAEIKEGTIRDEEAGVVAKEDELKEVIFISFIPFCIPKLNPPPHQLKTLLTEKQSQVATLDAAYKTVKHGTANKALHRRRAAAVPPHWSL